MSTFFLGGFVGGGRGDRKTLNPAAWTPYGPGPRTALQTRGPFLESPETLRAIYGCHNALCIS